MISSTLKVHHYWCTQQKQDFEEMMLAVDNVGAASLALASNGAQAYSQFIEARDTFKEAFTEMTKRYRYVEEH